MQSVKSILLNEGLQDLLSSVLHDDSRLLQLLLTALPRHTTLDFCSTGVFWGVLGTRFGSLVLQISLPVTTCFCCNLSGGVVLIVWFTTNGMCVKNNTIQICGANKQ